MYSLDQFQLDHVLNYLLDHDVLTIFTYILCNFWLMIKILFFILLLTQIDLTKIK